MKERQGHRHSRAPLRTSEVKHTGVGLVAGILSESLLALPLGCSGGKERKQCLGAGKPSSVCGGTDKS